MAKATKTAPRADLLEKDPSDMHNGLAEFIQAQTGYEPDVRTIQLVTVLRKPFQKSDSHQTALAQRKDERASAAAERKAAKKTAPAKTTAKKAGGKKASSKAGKSKAAAEEDPF